ncbi:MAG: alginate export family protein [Deltaproteobacteria bacterium]|nr:alginate export family protein [Deltaproteobacteria bacterium]
MKLFAIATAIMFALVIAAGAAHAQLSQPAPQPPPSDPPPPAAPPPAWTATPPAPPPPPKAGKPRPVSKMTEDDLRQIAGEEARRAVEDAKRTADEARRAAEEAVKNAEEAKRKAIEEAAKAVSEARKAAEDGKRAAAEQAKAAVDENNRLLDAKAREREESGPGWVLPRGWVLKPVADFFFRTELNDNRGDFRTSFNDRDWATGQRVEIGLDAAFLDVVRAAVIVQDVRMWGHEGLQTYRATKGPGGEVGAVIPDTERFTAFYTGAYGTSLAEGWAQIGNFGGVPLTLKVGRLRPFYGDGRILGNGHWTFMSTAFDGVQVRYTRPSFWLEAFASKPRESEIVTLTAADGTVQLYDTPGDDLLALYLATKWIPGGRLDAYVFFNRQGPYPFLHNGSDLVIATPGARVDGNAGRFNYNAEIAGQFGDNRGLDHSAMAADALFGWDFDASMEPGLGVGYSFATGNKDSQTSSQFLEFYPAHDLRFGLLGMTGWTNIHAVRVGGDFVPSLGLLLALDVRYFALASSRGSWIDRNGRERGLDVSGEQGRQLGWEIDLRGDYDFNQWLNLSAGYGVFVPLEFVADQDPDGNGPVQAFGGDPAHFGYLMLKLAL